MDRLARSVASAIVITVLGIAPAQAEASGSAEVRAGTCKLGYVCMWEDANHKGSKYVNWKPTNGSQKFQIDWWDGDNEISSVYNNSPWTVTLYADDYDYEGSNHNVCSMAKENLKDFFYNDEAESASTTTRLTGLSNEWCNYGSWGY